MSKPVSKPVGKAVDNPFADLEELVVPEPKPLDERLGGASASVDKLCDDSVVKALLRLPPEERAAFVRDVPEEAIQLIGYSWQDWARREQLPPPGKWGTWLILAGRGMGKLAALDTEIPTASGWKTFGTVEVGDQLWDERGQPCTVTALHPINETPESYRVMFTGGAVVDCCADHLWTVVTDAERRRLDALHRAEWWGTSPHAAVVPTRALLGRPQYAGGCDAFVYTGKWRQVLSIEPIPPVPMRCITVDSPSGLFLITRHYVPTHNTRSGAEFIRAKVAAGAKRIALVGRTAGDVRDTMIFGESGIMAVTPPAERPRYIRADRALIWPNGAQALLATAMEPDILRGPQFEVGWSDELACFPGDTMVLLGDGAQKRIDAVQVGDTVATRSGPRRVGRSVLSGIATELVEALDAEGRVVVRATPNHRVWVAGRGFVPLASVRPMDILVACRSTSGSSTLVNAGTRTGGTGTTGTDPENCSTDGSMQTHTASCSGADTTSTTSTVYAGTTASRISRSSHLLNMPRLTDCAATARGPQRSVDKSSPMRGCGGNSAPSSASCAEWTCVPTECERSSVRDDALRPTSEGGTAYPNTQMAPYATSDGVSRAECSSVPEGPQTPIATVPVSVHGLRAVPANEPVYDIGVEGDHEFFANGILVHNSWFYPETWDNLMMCMRLGANPQVVTTTTPRPTDLIRSLVRDPTVTVTRGSTYDNAGNLPEAYITRMTEKYAGTRLGKQELYAEILDDTSGALWKMTDIPHVHQVPERLVRVITGVDPTVQAQGRSDEVGIVTVGVGESGRLYVLEDASGQMSPALWAEATIRSANRWGAHLIVAEGNQGGDLVRTNIIAAPLLSPDRLGIPGLKQVVIPPINIVHARVGKVARAEPVVSLYQQRRVVHVGQHAALEDQMTTWIPDVNARSPGRIDALVWAATYVIDLVRSQSAPSRGKVVPFLVPNTPDRGAY